MALSAAATEVQQNIIRQRQNIRKPPGKKNFARELHDRFAIVVQRSFSLPLLDVRKFRRPPLTTRVHSGIRLLGCLRPAIEQQFHLRKRRVFVIIRTTT